MKTKIKKEIFLTIIMILSSIELSNAKHRLDKWCSGEGGNYQKHNEICYSDDNNNGLCGNNATNTMGCVASLKCTDTQYCSDWVSSINFWHESGWGHGGGITVCVECKEIPQGVPVLYDKATKTFNVIEFGQATIDPNLIEY